MRVHARVRALHADTPVFVLGPKYDPYAPTASECDHISQVSAPIDLYMMMGRDLSPMPAAYAGSIVGIGGLGSHVLKTATLCTTPACTSLSPMTFQVCVRSLRAPRLPLL